MHVHGVDDLSRLFESITQGERAQTFGTPGQGLALAIVLRLSQLLGARLTAERAQQGGATFTLSLPLGAIGMASAVDAPAVH
jgi:signal transduction histidine kinase